MKPPRFLPLLAAFALTALVRADDYEARTFTAADGATLGYRLLAPTATNEYDPEMACHSV